MGADIVAIWIGRIILAVIVTVVLVWMLRRVGSTLTQLVGYIENYLKKRGRGINFRSVEVLSADAIHRFILSLVGTARVIATFSLLYAWLLVVAWSLDASRRVFGVVEQPLLTALTTVATAIVGFIPNLMMLVIIVVLARLSTRLIGASLLSAMILLAVGGAGVYSVMSLAKRFQRASVDNQQILTIVQTGRSTFFCPVCQR